MLFSMYDPGYKTSIDLFTVDVGPYIQTEVVLQCKVAGKPRDGTQLDRRRSFDAVLSASSVKRMSSIRFVDKLLVTDAGMTSCSVR